MLICGLSVLGLLIILSILVNVTPVQNFLVRQVSHKLSKQLHTEVKIDHVKFKLFNRFLVQGAYVADEQGDTLLYAKDMSVNVTNFFFLKNKTVLYYVGMDSVTVNLKRPPGDSVWNFQFIIDAFTKPGPHKKKELPNISLRRIDLKNIRVNQLDGWKGKDMHISANRIAINAQKIDLRKHTVNVKNIDLENPLFVLEKYPATEPPDTSLAETDASPPEKDSTELRWNKQHWRIQAGKINIKKGAFALIKREEKGIEKYFDPKHIAFYDINGTLNRTRFDKDSVISRLDLTAKERSGLLVKKLQGRFKMSPVTIEVSDLDLVTNRSHITNFFALQFKQFSDLADFVTKVTMRGNFVNSEVSSDDIGFFAPPLLKWNKNIKINGLAYGTLDMLTGDDMHIQAGKSTTLAGSISMTGLPDINNTFIDFQAKKLVTTGRDIQQFVPQLKQNKKLNLDSLTHLEFKGNYVGFIYDFVAYGTFTTNLGTIHSDLNLKFGPRHKIPVYSGSLSSDGFDVGAFINSANLGHVAFNTHINGAGFNLSGINANIKGEISQLEYNGYNYHQIQLEGALKKKLFQGHVAIADSNLALNFQGKIDFNDSIPRFNFQSEITKSNLRALNITKDSVLFSGKLNLNFRGDNLDNFMGEARLYDINLYNNHKRIAFDTLVVNSFKDRKNNSKWLTVKGNEVSGYIHGDYNLTQIPDVALLFLHQYFPNKIKAPSLKNTGEQFDFALQLGHVDSILHSFLPNLSILNDGQITGRVNTPEDSLKLQLNFSHAGYKNYIFNDIRILANGTKQGLKTENYIGETYIKDSLLLPQTTIHTFTRRDSSLITLQTTGHSALNKANLKVKLITLKDGYDFKILQSALVINNKDWHISPGNEIQLKKKDITIHHFNIFHNNQSITLASTDTSTLGNSFEINLKNIYIADFAPFFVPDVLLEGISNGKFNVVNPLNEMKISGDLTTRQFRVNDDSIGTVVASAAYDKDKQTFQWNFHKTDNAESNFLIKGLIGTGSNKSLKGSFDLQNTNIGVLNSFVKGYVSNLRGYATGQVHFDGNKDDPQIIGSLKLHKVDFTVDYTKVYYSLDNETIKFLPGKIDIGSLTLKDKEGRTGILSGSITHHHFDDLFFHLNVNTRGLQLLHTTLKDNPVYYGDAIAAGKIDFSGPLSDMKMVINATPVEGTHIVLPLSDDEDIGKHDFIVFKKYGKEINAAKKNKRKVNLNVKLYANMNPQAQIDVIVDATSGDHITARGNGALQINVNLDGDFQMFGNYSLTEGYYIFSFKGLLSRKFAINKGSTISWNGDPSNANINITAIYHVPGGANLYNLIAGEGATTVGLTKDDKRLLRQREKIDVYLFLKNSLMHPDISYDIRIPEASISASSLAMTKLQQIRQNPNILINQVAALLAAGQFIPVNSGTATSGGILRSSGLSSAGQWVSSQLNGVLNNLFGSKLNDLGLSFNLNYNAYSASGNYGDIQRNDVQFNLSKTLFNNRVQLEVGPSINWGRSNTPQASNTSYFAGDFRLEYLITPDGRVRFLAFSRSNYNVLLNQNLTRAGIGISYSRRFDRLHELFRSKREKKRLDSIRNARFKAYLEENQEEENLRNPSYPPTDSTIIPQSQPAIKEDE